MTTITTETRPRYETARELTERIGKTDSVVCTKCGAFVMNRAAHDRHHDILDRSAVALAILGAAHFSADAHDRYDTAGRIGWIGWKETGDHEPEGPAVPGDQDGAVLTEDVGHARVTGAARPSPAELWQQAGGSAGRYRQLLREHGHLLAPGDEGYDDAPGSLPCGWPRSASQVRRLEATGALTPDKTWPDPETLGVLLEAGLREEDGRGCMLVRRLLQVAEGRR